VHLAELLLQNGANADAVDDYGSSPLIAAAAAGVTVMPTGLLRRACFDDKMAALDLAVQAGNAALEETLRSVLGRQERTITGVDADASSVPSERISFVEQKAPYAAEPSKDTTPVKRKSGSGVSFFSKISTPRKKEDPILTALVADFGLQPKEEFLGRSVCTSQRQAPGVLSVVTSYICFKPNAAGGAGSDGAANPTLAPASMLTASGKVGLTGGRLILPIMSLTRAERTKRWRKAAGKNTKGYSIELTDKSGERHTFHGVLHCDLILGVLEKAAGALGIGTRRDLDTVFFLAMMTPPIATTTHGAYPKPMARSGSAYMNADL